MKKYLRSLIFLISFVVCLGFQGTSEAQAAKKVYLNKTSITLNYNQSYTLKLNNYKKEIIWASGDNTIATVSAKGVVKTKKVSGTVTISAKAGSTYYHCTVKVQSGRLSDSSIIMKKGTVYTIRKSAKYSAKWSSTNKKVATVSSSGKVTAKGKGTCYIKVKLAGKNSKCKVTVRSSYSKVTITPKTKPYNNKYVSTPAYKKDPQTRTMYTIRSYLNRFETEGGGTLVLKKGNYGLKAGVFVPSNVTIQLDNGTTVYKEGKVNSENYKVSIFSVVNPSVVTATTAEAAGYKEAYRKEYLKKHPKAKATVVEEKAQSALENSGYQFPSAVKGYNGSKNVVIKGAKGGNSTIDHKGKFYTFGIATGHANGLTIQDINFKNMDGNHFIELNSSRNVLIQRCTFTDDLTTFDWNEATGKGYYNDVIAVGDSKARISNKEAINIDSCDPNYKGFNNPWAYHDYTACDKITVQNCTFIRIVRPIGTHKYTCKYNSKTKKWDIQVYNTNIKILNNKFIDTGCNAITMCNWNKSTVSGNTISTVNNLVNNPYKDSIHQNESFFYSVNPSKKVDGKTVVGTRTAIKQQAAIVIFGGGADIYIYKNTINDAIVGVAAFNLQNMNGAAKNQPSLYKLNANSKNYIKNNNTYTNISSKCNYFFCNDSTIAQYGNVLRTFSGKREYLPSEYNIDWDCVLEEYYEKYFARLKGSDEMTESTESTETEVTTEEAYTTTEATTAEEPTTEGVTTEETQEGTNGNTSFEVDSSEILNNLENTQ